MQRVIGSERASGVAREDIQTDVINLERSRTRGSRRTTWVARNAVRVTVRRLANAGTVVDRAVGAGATSVDGPEPGVADAKAVYREALAAAFAEARAKAERLAREAGVTLGPIVRIRESGADAFIEERDRAAASPEQGAQVQGETPVEGGRTRVTATVAVIFATSARPS